MSFISMGRTGRSGVVRSLRTIIMNFNPLVLLGVGVALTLAGVVAKNVFQPPVYWVLPSLIKVATVSLLFGGAGLIIAGLFNM